VCERTARTVRRGGAGNGAEATAPAPHPTNLLLAAAEIAIGTALVLPVVPAWLAGTELTAFALGTLGLYLRTPGMRQEGSLRPTQQGIPLAKDAWMVGIGLALMIDEIAERASRS
jgi:hypothetical protein